MVVKEHTAGIAGAAVEVVMEANIESAVKVVVEAGIGNALKATGTAEASNSDGTV